MLPPDKLEYTSDKHSQLQSVFVQVLDAGGNTLKGCCAEMQVYTVIVKTSDIMRAGTDARVSFVLHGSEGSSEIMVLPPAFIQHHETFSTAIQQLHTVAIQFY